MSIAKKIESRSLLDNIIYDRKSMPSTHSGIISYQKPFRRSTLNKHTQFTNHVKPSDEEELFPNTAQDNYHKERDSNETLSDNYYRKSLGETEPIETDLRTIDPTDASAESLSFKSAITIRDYGEPRKPQYIRINFRPTSGVDDNEHVLNKCSEFWKFLDKHTELQNLKVKAESCDTDVSDIDSQASNSHISASHISALHVLASRISIAQDTIDKTTDEMELTPLTVLALNWLKQENIMSDSLATKQKRRYLDPIQRRYSDNYVKEQKENMAVMEKINSCQVTETKTHTSVTTTSMGPERNLPKIIRKPADDLTKLMAEMDEWDLEHPKSLIPPGHAPNLIHAEFINPKRILPFIGRNDEKTC